MEGTEQTFSRSFVEDGKYKVEQVTEFTFPIQQLTGNAIVTHFGGNGRFKFKLDNTVYITEFEPNICTTIENHGFDKKTDQYFDYSNVQFKIDPKQSWREQYRAHTTYWIEAK